MFLFVLCAYRAIERRASKQPVCVPLGRSPLFPDHVINRVKEAASKKDFEGDSFRGRRDVISALVTERNKISCSEQGDQTLLFPENISGNTMTKYKKKVCPKDSKAHHQTEARKRALYDIRNAISAIALWKVISEEVDPACCCNFDDFSVVLNDYGETTDVCLAEGSAEVLHERNLAPKVTETDEKKRTAHATSMTSFAGDLICFIVKIFDDNFKEPRFYEVGIIVYYDAYDKNYQNSNSRQADPS